MSRIKIPAGTRIYLMKKDKTSFFIQPGNILLNDNLYVAYDLRINGVVVIPRGTRVVGDWVTEIEPTIVAQLQLSKIYLVGSGQSISADSNVIQAINPEETNKSNIKFLTKKCRNKYKPLPLGRLSNLQCNIRRMDNIKNSLFMEIFTSEIPVTITEDIIITI